MVHFIPILRHISRAKTRTNHSPKRSLQSPKHIRDSKNRGTAWSIKWHIKWEQHVTSHAHHMYHPMVHKKTIPEHYAPNLGHHMPNQWHILGEQDVPFHGTFYGHTYCIYSKQWCTKGTIKWESYGPLNGNKMAHQMYHPMDHTPLFPKKYSQDMAHKWSILWYIV